jgi:hypothetical protein
LAAELKETGLTEPAGLFWGDEMRVGLLGQVQLVWAPRDVEIRQAVELKYEWEYLNLEGGGIEKAQEDSTRPRKRRKIKPRFDKGGFLKALRQSHFK